MKAGTRGFLFDACFQDPGCLVIVGSCTPHFVLHLLQRCILPTHRSLNSTNQGWPNELILSWIFFVTLTKVDCKRVPSSCPTLPNDKAYCPQVVCRSRLCSHVNRTSNIVCPASAIHRIYSCPASDLKPRTCPFPSTATRTTRIWP